MPLQCTWSKSKVLRELRRAGYRGKQLKAIFLEWMRRCKKKGASRKKKG